MCVCHTADKKGEVVVEYLGELISEEEGKRRDAELYQAQADLPPSMVEIRERRRSDGSKLPTLW